MCQTCGCTQTMSIFSHLPYHPLGTHYTNNRHSQKHTHTTQLTDHRNASLQHRVWQQRQTQCISTPLAVMRLSDWRACHDAMQDMTPACRVMTHEPVASQENITGNNQDIAPGKFSAQLRMQQWTGESSGTVMSQVMSASTGSEA